MKKSEKNSEEKNLSIRSLLRDVYIENKLKENRNSPKEDRLTDDQIRVIAKDEFTDSGIYRNHYKKLTEILQAFDKMINDSSTKADIYIKKLSEDEKTDIYTRCFLFVLMTIDSSKGSFYSKIKTGKPEKISKEEKIDFTGRVYSEILNSGYVPEYVDSYIDSEDLSLSEDEINERIINEWLDMVRDKYSEIIEDIEITEKEKDFPDKMKKQISERLEKVIDHSTYGGIVFPSFLLKKNHMMNTNSYDDDVTYYLDCNNGSRNPMFYYMRSFDRQLLLNGLEEKIKSALDSWEKEAQDYIYKKYIEENS